MNPNALGRSVGPQPPSDELTGPFGSWLDLKNDFHAWSFALLGLGLPIACAPAPVAPPAQAAPASEASASAAIPSASAASSAPAAAASASSPPASPASPCGDKQTRDAQGNCVAATCPSGQPPGADGSCSASPPCVDGEVLMGTCICSSGKGVDATGHCVFMPCPKSTSGGAVFRNPSTGQCMECRPGTEPCGDSCCSAGRSR